LESSFATAATFYDLIPLKHAETHLRSPVHRDWYLRKLESLKNAKLLLAISDYSRREAIDELGIGSDRIVNISAGVAPNFRLQLVKESEKAELLVRYRISRPFLLHTGDLNSQKNLEETIRGFASLPLEVRGGHQFVIVGQMNDVNRHKLLKLVNSQGMSDYDVLFTGYVSEPDLILLYNLCKAFVFPSLCEGFGFPALEAMACGAPTIGSHAASIPEIIGREDAMFDPTSTSSIAMLMHQVLVNNEFRGALRVHACSQSSKFSWDIAARRAVEAMEAEWKRCSGTTTRMASDVRYSTLLKKISELSKFHNSTEADLLTLAASISSNDFNGSEKQLLVDVSALVVQDVKTGIQRVVRSILSHLLLNPPKGYRIEPIYGDDCGCFRYAHRFLRLFQGLDQEDIEDRPIDARRGDILLGLDFSAHLFPVFRPTLAHFKRVGVKVYFIVYDIIPLLHPQWFTKGMPQAFAFWMEAIIAHADGLVCISASVADEVRFWRQEHQARQDDELKIGYFHLGADIDNSVPSRGLPDPNSISLENFRDTPTFLMVGTVEPRKGHAQTLAAFEQLWSEGLEVTLVIVGKAGWMVDALVERLGHHPLLGKRLFWLQGISDEYLEQIYAQSTALLAASKGEGFGLPLIEAAQHKLPIIARDIPVFREVAGDHAYYFNGESPEELAGAIKSWIKLNEEGSAPRSDGMPWLTWRQSTQQLLDVILMWEGDQMVVEDSKIALTGC
jgi:glycosyltransferase involved in cell wall biosynthesis